jgi:hypothetical protein
MISENRRQVGRVQSTLNPTLNIRILFGRTRVSSINIAKIVCRKCKEPKILSEMKKDSRKPSGVAAICKQCQGASTKDYVQKNQEKVKASSRACYLKHRTEVRDNQKAYYESHREEWIAYRIANRARIRAWENKRRAAKRQNIPQRVKLSPEQFREWCRVYSKRWREKNKESLAAQRREKDRNRRAKRRLYEQEYARKNRTLLQSYSRNRKARMRGAEGRHTGTDIEHIWKRQKQRCAISGCINPIAVSGPNRYHVDHITALANGGSNWPENLQILCGSHNMEKHTKDEYRWAQQHGLLFVK